VSTSARAAHKGQEILVVDRDEKVLRGLDKLFRDMEMLVTAVPEVARAQDQLGNKFFPVALIDMDTPDTDKGLDLIRFAKEQAPLTAMIVMTGRRTFEAAAEAFRAGAADVVPKTQDAVAYLRNRVMAACEDVAARSNRERLLTQLSESHAEFLQEMMALSRRIVDLEDRLVEREEISDPSMVGLQPVSVLVVDDDAELASALDKLLAVERGWQVRIVRNGGEALDAATNRPPQVLVIKEKLPDLPSSMVIKTIKASAPDATAILYTAPGSAPVGEVKVVEQSRMLTLVPSFTEVAQLAKCLEEVREALKQKAKERRYLRVFRRDHLQFLNRYNKLAERLKQDLAPRDANKD
jgi:DNA-binding NtrC family response regulator